MEKENKISNNEYEFLNFTQKDYSLFSNLAKNCSNFTFQLHVHLTPYYFCILCKKEFCYYCMLDHLINNYYDKNHNLSCITSKELIKYKKNQLFKEILQNNKYVLTSLNSQEKEIKTEKNKLLDIKDFINTKDDLKNYNNNNIPISQRKNQIEQKELKILNRHEHKNSINYIQESNDLIKLHEIKNIIKTNFKTVSKVNEDVYKKKKEMLKDIIFSLNDIHDKKILIEIFNLKTIIPINKNIEINKNKFINSKRKRSNNNKYNEEITNDISDETNVGTLQIYSSSSNDNDQESSLPNENSEIIQTDTYSNNNSIKKLKDIKDNNVNISLNIIKKNLTKDDLIVIDENIKSQKYIMYFNQESAEIFVFSSELKEIFKCKILMKNKYQSSEIDKTIFSTDYKTINANNYLYIIGKKNVCRIEYNPYKKNAKVELINKTIYTRKKCAAIYCIYYHKIILVGGEESPRTSEYLNLYNISEGWKPLKKQTRNNIIDGQLFILNNTKLFVLYKFNNNNSTDYHYNCEMNNLKEDNNLDINKYWKEIKINNNINIMEKIGIINYKYLNEDTIIIYGGNNNKFYCYNIHYNKLLNEMEEKEINISEEIPIFYSNNFVSLNTMKILDDNNNNLDSHKDVVPLNFNFDVDGNLWIFYSYKLRIFE